MYGGFQGGPQLGPPDAERRQSLGQQMCCRLIGGGWKALYTVLYILSVACIAVMGGGFYRGAHFCIGGGSEKRQPLGRLYDNVRLNLVQSHIGCSRHWRFSA